MVPDMYQSFITAREDEKKGIYSGVIKLGLIAIVFGCSLIFIGYFYILVLPAIVDMYNYSFGDTLYVVVITLIIIGMLCINSGIVILSTVPTNEFDIDDILFKKTWLRNLFASNFINYGLITGVMPPYIGGVCFLAGIWTILPSDRLHLFNSARIHSFSLRAAIWFLISFFGLYPATFYYAFSPDSFMSEPYILFLLEKQGGYLVDEPEYFSVAAIFMSTVFLISQILFAVHLYRNIGMKTPTTLLYDSIYTWIFAVGLGLIIFALFIISRSIDDPSLPFSRKYEMVSFLVNGFSLTVPVIIVTVLTRERVYCIMARRFELDPDRLKKDGAFMAELVSCKTAELGSSWWIKRDALGRSFSAEDTRFDSSNARRFWVKGEIVEIDAISFKVKVDLEYDRSDWSIDGNSIGDKIPNTGTNDIIIVEDSFACNSMARNELLHWAQCNLRFFDWQDFREDLLIRSPRELKHEDKDFIFNLSRPLPEGQKIDFFMSHSWSDDAELKIKALNAFASDFERREKRLPTLWFDKVCIDQRCPDRSLQVLPVNIQQCKQLLLVLGHTYFERIWCVWELYTLFSFCREDLAVERIEILPLDPDLNVIDMLESFDIEKSHCFNPNEEAKLRRIISHVGSKRFNSCIHKLAAIFRDQDQRSSVMSILQSASGISTKSTSSTKSTASKHVYIGK